MPTHYVLSRKDFERLCLVKDSDSKEEHKLLLTNRYPTNTGGAAAELRMRGLDADWSTLHYLIRKGKVPAPPSEGRDLAWSAEHIDAAALVLLEMGKLSPAAYSHQVNLTDYAQDLQAQQEFHRENPGVPLSLAVKEIIPGPEGVCPNVIRYRLPSAKEQAEIQTRVHAARKHRK